MKIKKNGITLVESILIITILSIFGSIIFIILQGSSCYGIISKYNSDIKKFGKIEGFNNLEKENNFLKSYNNCINKK